MGKEGDAMSSAPYLRAAPLSRIKDTPFLKLLRRKRSRLNISEHFTHFLNEGWFAFRGPVGSDQFQAYQIVLTRVFVGAFLTAVVALTIVPSGPDYNEGTAFVGLAPVSMSIGGWFLLLITHMHAA
jgi:hypothetical protein